LNSELPNRELIVLSKNSLQLYMVNSCIRAIRIRSASFRYLKRSST